MKVNTAIVLAGGPGTRLKPLTNDLPKAMIEVHGKPLLQWVIEWLQDNEITQVILGVAHLKEKIIEYFDDGREFGINIKYSVHTIDGGTGEGLRLAISRYVNCDVFFAMNSDQLTDLNLSNVVNFHLKHNPIATMVVTNPRCPYGHIQVDDGYNAIGFVEKPSCLHAFCNAGIYVFNKEILHHLPEKGNVEETTFPILAQKRQLKTYPLKGFFATVNTHKDLAMAEQELTKWESK
jgi:NDP-sugar pyrophosphorylase family protein